MQTPIHNLETPAPELLGRSVEILACPVCGGDLRFGEGRIVCSNCAKIFALNDGRIPLLFAPTDPELQRVDVTEMVKAFYEENPFPNYDDLDSDRSLAEKAQRGLFVKLLDEQIPHGAFVLEVGCGTGQLTNFLGMRWNRRVFGSDMCLNSLRLAEGFRDRWNIKNAGFVQMNLFRPAFKEAVFDVVISNGVLHHTADPLGAFQSISRLVKPGGVILIGLYNKVGRLTTDLRRFLFRVSGNRLSLLDSHMRNKQYNADRKRTWFLDQYKHPHESKHTYTEVMGWFESNGFEYLFSVPKVAGGHFTKEERLFERHDQGTKMTRFITELEMLLAGGEDGALFIMIGRKVKT